MLKEYPGVITRLLRKDERMFTSEESAMPLVIEADTSRDKLFLQNLLKQYSAQILEDVARYGAVLLRGFDIASEADFEKTVLSVQGLEGIREAFMSEEGRVPVGDLQFVLHTNAVYKTGGTLYLGGFHSENYYSADVPAYINFCCLKPSQTGGETGLVNMEKIYAELDPALQKKLEKHTFFVDKWLVSEVAERYNLPAERVEDLCKEADLPVIGEGKNKCILMYKPSVIKHPLTEKKSLFMNLFEIGSLNKEMRKCFMADYSDQRWYWHRFFWKMPAVPLKIIESVYIMFASFFHSPATAMQILSNKIKKYQAGKKLPRFNQTKAGSCFTDQDIKQLAELIRKYYSSCLWEQGDILLVDNRKVMHAGMPGAGARLVRAMICNLLTMPLSFTEPGYINAREKNSEAALGLVMKTQAKEVTERQIMY